MTYTLKRPERTFTQRPVAVVWGNPDRLHFIDTNGEYKDGPPEEIWRLLAFPQPVIRNNISRGQSYKSKAYQNYVVITPHKGSIRNLINTCDARHWTGITKQSGKYHTLTHEGGPTVYRLFHDAHPEDVMTALIEYVSFLNEHNCVFKSTVTGGGLALFKTTIAEPIKLWAPNDIVHALWSGRAEHLRGRYECFWDMAYYDLKQAYPTALSDSPIPTRWHQTNPENWRKYPDGFSYATVAIPHDRPGPNPVPKRLPGGKRQKKQSYATGVFSDWWPHRDLSNAYDLGYVVRVTTTWAPDAYMDAFQSDSWQSLRQELRSLPGLAGLFGKEADNGLWGLLSYDASKQKKVTWTDRDATTENEKTIAEINGTRNIHGLSVAVCASARVREKLWRAMRATDAVYCATDGIIAKDGQSNVLSSEWVLKEHMNYVSIKDVNCYAYYTSASPLLQYKGGKERFDAHDGKPGYLEGDLETGLLPSMSIRKLYEAGYLHD